MNELKRLGGMLKTARLVALIIILIIFAILFAFYLIELRKRRPSEELKEILKEIEEKGIRPIPRKFIPLEGKACWIWDSTFREYGVDYVIDKIGELGIKHIFVLVKGTGGSVVKEIVSEVLPKAHERGMYVHAWIVCFKDRSRADATPDSYSYRKYLLEIILDFLLLNSSGHFVDGIHLDYICYGGFAHHRWRAISLFVKEVRELIDKVAPGAILSIASKAEKYDSKTDLLESALFYGQSYEDLSKYVDLFCPMTYYLDYNIPPNLVGIASRWIKEVTKKPVFAGIQLHPSEHPETEGKEPELDELLSCFTSCLENGINGVIFFRFEMLLLKWDKYSELIKNFKI